MTRQLNRRRERFFVLPCDARGRIQKSCSTPRISRTSQTRIAPRLKALSAKRCRFDQHSATTLVTVSNLIQWGYPDSAHALAIRAAQLDPRSRDIAFFAADRSIMKSRWPDVHRFGEAGECHGSCRMSRHAAVRPCVSRSSFVGFSRTVVTGVQLRVAPHQRAGCWARAAA